MRMHRWPGAAGISDRLDVLLYEDQFRKVAGFLVADEDRPSRESRLSARGTVVFVRVPILELPGEVWHLTYAVTALHCLLRFNEDSALSKLRIRVNRRDKSLRYVDVPAPFAKWHKHETEDVAAIPVISRQPVDIESMGPSDLLQESERHRYRPGDEVFLSGLFSYHPGNKVIEPILRFGHLSLVPREPVSIRIKSEPEPLAKCEAFLVEAQTWEGQSGSPVFAYEDNGRPGPLSMKMIGIAHGYTTERLGAGATGPYVNAGITVVVPAYRVWELLTRGDVVDDQNRRAAEIRNGEPKRIVQASGVTDSEDGNPELGRFRG
jgi:hypothetical protein